MCNVPDGMEAWVIQGTGADGSTVYYTRASGFEYVCPTREHAFEYWMHGEAAEQMCKTLRRTGLFNDVTFQVIPG